jgi:hypothetical protein
MALRKLALKSIEKGQIWKLEDRHIQIVHVGKTLAQYKETKTLQQRGAPTHFKQIAVLQEFLAKEKAKLIQKPAAPAVATKAAA